MYNKKYTSEGNAVLLAMLVGAPGPEGDERLSELLLDGFNLHAPPAAAGWLCQSMLHNLHRYCYQVFSCLCTCSYAFMCCCSRNSSQDSSQLQKAEHELPSEA